MYWIVIILAKMQSTKHVCILRMKITIIYIYIYIYIYRHTHTHTHTHIYIYIYIYITDEKRRYAKNKNTFV